MKKVLFLILTLLILTYEVKANVWQEEKIEGENVITETRYRFYKETKTGEYLRKGIVSNYQYEDQNDIIYTDYSDYQNTCPTDKGYEVEYATKYEYQERLKVKYLKINNISQKNLSIKNLEFKVNDEVINYTYYSCTKCNSDLTTINSTGVLIIELDTYVNFENLIVSLEFNNITSKLYYELQYSDDISFSVDHMIAILTANTLDINYQYKVNNFYLYPNYSEVYTEYDIEENDLMQNVVKEKVCKVREVKTYHYNKVKEYYDDNYYKDVSELTLLSNEEKLLFEKDLNDYKVYYLNTTNEKEDSTIDEEDKQEDEINNNRDNTDNEVKEEITDQVDNKEEENNSNSPITEEDKQENEIDNNNDDNTNNEVKEEIKEVIKENEQEENNLNNSITKENNQDNIITEKEEDNTNTQINEQKNNLKLVKTGITKQERNYRYLIIYVLVLILITLIMIKYLKRMSK